MDGLHVEDGARVGEDNGGGDAVLGWRRNAQIKAMNRTISGSCIDQILCGE